MFYSQRRPLERIILEVPRALKIQTGAKNLRFSRAAH